MKKYILLLIAALTALTVFTGCGSSDESSETTTEETTEGTTYENDEDNPEAEIENQLVGLWTSGRQYIEFKANKSFVAMGEDNSEYLGTYSLVANGSTMALALAEDENNIRTYVAEFKNNMKTLILTDENDEKTEFEYSEVKE